MKKQLHTILIVLFAFAFFQQAAAQDPRFSQFYAAPMHLNPAMTGVFSGSWRVTMNYRDQWSSILQQRPYRTFGAAYDMRLNVAGNDYFAFGLNFLNDQAGLANLRQTQGHLSLSYLKQLSGSYGGSQQYLVAGGQIGFGQHQIGSEVWFSDQFDIATENLDLSQASLEDINASNNPYMDVNIGLLWYALWDENFSLYAGGALNHINKPDIALIENGSATLPSRWVGHVGGEIPLNNELSILPAFAFTGQGSSNSLTLGTNFRYTNHDWRELAVRIGSWLHLSNTVENFHADALIFSAILEMERFNLGISYDINISSLTVATNSRGTVELSFIYTHPEQRRTRVKCPNF